MIFCTMSLLALRKMLFIIQIDSFRNPIRYLGQKLEAQSSPKFNQNHYRITKKI